MKNYPFGDPVFFEGEYKQDNIYDLYIQQFQCGFKLKENKIPTVQIKGSMFYMGNEYLEKTNDDEIVVLTMTSVDLKLFLEQYETYELKYLCGWKFRSIKGLFKNYIDKWIEKKNNATIEGNAGKRAVAKKMLNSLYGKFAKSLDVRSKIPYLQDDIVHYKYSDTEECEGVYLPVRVFYNSPSTR